MYIVRRTQLYLDDQLWDVLHSQAKSTGKTISELVRNAVRDSYIGNLDRRREAMQALIGIRKDRAEFDDPEYIRHLRRSSRLENLEKK